MKRPAFQFYPADWRNNAKLRRCSFLERGIWLEVLCLFHDSDDYGMLRWPLKDIAQAIGCRLSELKNIAAKGVIKGGDIKIEPYTYRPRHAGKEGAPVVLIPGQGGPLWYSSRMVRDEFVRSKRGECTRFGDEPKPPIGDPPSAREGDGPSSSSSTSSTKKKEESAFALPDWVPAEQWDAWLEIRKKIRAPNTDYALRLSVKQLERLRDAGDDPTAVLEKAVARGWRGLFPLNGSATPDYSAAIANLKD